MRLKYANELDENPAIVHSFIVGRLLRNTLERVVFSARSGIYSNRGTSMLFQIILNVSSVDNSAVGITPMTPSKCLIYKKKASYAVGWN